MLARFSARTRRREAAVIDHRLEVPDPPRVVQPTHASRLAMRQARSTTADAPRPCASRRGVHQIAELRPTGTRPQVVITAHQLAKQPLCSGRDTLTTIGPGRRPCT